jgi:hypothetical protein
MGGNTLWFRCLINGRQCIDIELGRGFLVPESTSLEFSAKKKKDRGP